MQRRLMSQEKHSLHRNLQRNEQNNNVREQLPARVGEQNAMSPEQFVCPKCGKLISQNRIIRHKNRCGYTKTPTEGEQLKRMVRIAK